MVRFQTNRTKSKENKLLVSFLAFLIVLFLFLIGIKGLSQTTVSRQREQLETALSRAVTYSYATYGYYPEDLETLIQEYKIHYNRELFYVDYQILGGNLFPEITILTKEGEQ